MYQISLTLTVSVACHLKLVSLLTPKALLLGARSAQLCGDEVVLV